jgi:hypothetical protein
MIDCRWFALVLLPAAGWAADAQLSPKDFAYGMPVTTPAPAAAYRVDIPLEVYQKSVHEDLSDLRIFNASGEVVPYEFQQPLAQSSAREPDPSLPFFPLRGDVQAALDGVRVTIQSLGTAVHVQAGETDAASQTVNGYVLDARELTLPILTLRLHWPEGAPEFTGRIRVESSDDLGSWHPVSNDAPVVNLHTHDAELVQGRIDVPSTKAKFWRLTWIGKSAPFELTSVTADVTGERHDLKRSSLSVVGTPVNDRREEFFFDLSARLPVTQVDLALPQSNSVVKIELLSRARTTDPWRPIAHADFYRVQGTDSERSNEALPILPDPDRYWLARLDQASGQIGDGALKLQATWNTEDVVFLAKGAGPYLLAYGNGSAVAASSSLSTLLAGVTVLPAQLGITQSLGGAARLLPPPRAVAWKLAVLWGALGLGVLLLAWMAYRLAREIGQRKV